MHTTDPYTRTNNYAFKPNSHAHDGGTLAESMGDTDADSKQAMTRQHSGAYIQWHTHNQQTSTIGSIQAQEQA